jgi:hypothetical protein
MLSLDDSAHRASVISRFQGESLPALILKKLPIVTVG